MSDKLAIELNKEPPARLVYDFAWSCGLCGLHVYVDMEDKLCAFCLIERAKDPNKSILLFGWRLSRLRNQISAYRVK